MKQFLLVETNDSRLILVDDGLGFQNLIDNFSKDGLNPRVKFVNDYFSAIKFVTGGKSLYSYFLIARKNKLLGIVHTKRTRLTSETYVDFQWSAPVSKDEAQRYFVQEGD